MWISALTRACVDAGLAGTQLPVPGAGAALEPEVSVCARRERGHFRDVIFCQCCSAPALLWPVKPPRPAAGEKLTLPEYSRRQRCGCFTPLQHQSSSQLCPGY